MLFDDIRPLKDNIAEIFRYKYEGVCFGDMVRNVMYRFYKSMDLPKGAETVAWDFLRVSLCNYYQVKRLYEENDYDFLLCSHGIYATWGPIVEFCKQEGRNFVCYDRAKKRGTLNFNFNQVAPNWQFESAWRRYKHRQLSEQEMNQVNSYIEERELQNGDVFAYNFSKREKSIDSLKERFSIPSNKKVITLFTNLIWDAANVSRDIAFSSMKDCIIKTINKYGNREDVHLIVRAHPAEKVLGTNQRYCDIVKQEFGSTLPENISLVGPEDDVNSFSIIDISDIGVVNTSTVGIEFAMENKPIVLLSDTHFRNKGFTFDVANETEYFEIIDQLLKKSYVKPDQVSLSKKYFFMMMFKYQIEGPAIYWNNKFNGYKYKHFDDISKHDSLRNVVNQIKNGNLEDFVVW